MKQRIISGVFIAIFFVVFGLVGGYLLAAGLMVCALIGFFELCRATRVFSNGKMNALVYVGFVMSVLFYVGLMVLQAHFGAQTGLMDLMHYSDLLTLSMVILDFLVTMAVYVLTFPRFRAGQVMASFFAFLYCPILMSFCYRSRMLPLGLAVYCLIFCASSVSDVCALAFGMAFGKHKLAPVLSPKKTIEGAVGGVFGATVVSALLGFVLHQIDPAANVIVQFTLIGCCGSVLSQIGDLAASAIKRNVKIKDYGKLIPGHGGIMDRFDSILFTAPIIYILGFLLLGRM